VAWEHPIDGRPDTGNRSSPAIADIDDDGHLEVIAGVEEGPQAGLVAMSAGDGATEWRWEAPASPGEGMPRGVAASPSLGDLDGDGRLEVVFLSRNGVVYALDSDCP
jgi:hypothetical protein